MYTGAKVLQAKFQQVRPMREAEVELRNSDFIKLVKRTREAHGCSIQEAHDRIFADEDMRRLVALRINRDPQCRKMASQDVRRRGSASRFERVGEKLRFKRPGGQRPE
ncbi:MAG: hypothetical protein AB3N06_06570 [Erythrobacter sp.]